MPALYERVRDLVTAEEFEARVEETVRSWGDRLDRDAAARLAVDRLGRGHVELHAVRELREGMEVTLRVRVGGVGDVRTFPRKDGGEGRVVNLDISDDSGTCRLVLWDEDVELALRGRIRRGTILRLIDCYVRSSRFGVEVSRGRFGAVIVES